MNIIIIENYINLIYYRVSLSPKKIMSKNLLHEFSFTSFLHSLNIVLKAVPKEFLDFKVCI